MALRNLFRGADPDFSFEVFPSKTSKGLSNVISVCGELAALQPSLITCTYGAGGSTKGMTLEVLSSIRSEHKLPTAAHLTCIGNSCADISDWLRRAESIGVENIMALRGDMPKDQTLQPSELHYASDLVGFIKENFPNFGIGVAGYPETHREAKSPEADLENLKRKVDAGADIVFTQLFFDNEDFFRFRERCDRIGIRVPIVPGLLPVSSRDQLGRLTQMCGAKMPDGLHTQLGAYGEDADAQRKVGTEFAIAQVQELLASGVPGIHFYVLNRSDMVRQILGEVSFSSQKSSEIPTLFKH